MKQSTTTTIIVVVGLVAVLGIGYLLLNSNNKTAEQENMAEPATEMVKEEVKNEEPVVVMEEKNIVQLAVEAGSFKTLLAAVEAAGLVETLSGPGPFTVFAPTDEAFAKLPEGTVESLLKDKEKLTQILTYHVVAGKVMASDVVQLTSAKTLQGQEVKISVENGTVMVDNAKVVTTDIVGSNGVIHVIDSVLLPQ